MRLAASLIHLPHGKQVILRVAAIFGFLSDLARPTDRHIADQLVAPVIWGRHDV